MDRIDRDGGTYLATWQADSGWLFDEPKSLAHHHLAIAGIDFVAPLCSNSFLLNYTKKDYAFNSNLLIELLLSNASLQLGPGF